jgi:hypothetical protein
LCTVVAPHCSSVCSVHADSL